MEKETKADRWSVDKKVPLALIATLGLQAIALVIWAATMTQTVNQLQTDNAKSDVRMAKMEDAIAGLPLLQYQVSQTSEATGRIETKVDNLVEKTRD